MKIKRRSLLFFRAAEDALYRSPPEFSAKIVRLIAKEKFAFYGERKGRGTPKTRSEISKDFPKPWDVP